MNEKMIEITDCKFKSVSRKMQTIFLEDNVRLSDESTRLGLFVLERGPISVARAAQEFGVSNTAIINRFRVVTREIATFASYLEDFDDNTPIQDFRLNLSIVPVSSLLRNNIKNVGDIKRMTVENLLSIRNLGKDRVAEVYYALKSNNVKVDDSIELYMTICEEIKNKNIEPEVLYRYINCFGMKSTKELQNLTIEDILSCSNIAIKRTRKMFKYYMDKGIIFNDSVIRWINNETC